MEDDESTVPSQTKKPTRLQDFIWWPMIKRDANLWDALIIFGELIKYPRPSKGESAAREYVLQVASDSGWKAKRDAAGNLAVIVPATAGRENAVPIVLQGHLDIVTSPADRDLPRSAEVILNDGYPPWEAGYWIQSTGQKMTLGADNGIGIALALATLRDPNLEHGPVTVLLTVDEESGMSGAQALDPDLLPERGLLVNLDSEEGAETVCIGCAGAQDVTAEMPICRLPVPEGHTCFEVRLSGWPGGHSGCEIHAGNGNPIQTLARMLDQLGPDIRLISIDGGTARNAIPSEATAVVAIPDSAKNLLFSVLIGMNAVLMTSPDWDWSYGLTGEKAGRTRASASVVSSDNLGIIGYHLQKKVLASISESPTGPFASAELPLIGELVTLSNNLGTVETGESFVRLGYMLRSADTEASKPVLRNLERMLGFYGNRIDSGEMTAGWLEDPNESPAVAAASSAVKAVCGQFKYLAYHAGLECGIIVDRRSALSAVSLGPLILEAHTPRERVSLQSIREELEVLRHLLENA